jgi:nucleoside triphosphate pyrophosphatase
MRRVVLASASPRRRELLEQLGLTIEIAPADVDESVRAAEDPVPYVLRLAEEKAAVVAGRHGFDAQDDVLVIAADTTVDIDGRILAKPEDEADARAMLRALSARAHRVHTGVAVRRGGRTMSRSATTLVTFTPVTDAALDWYLATGEPFDKAGAYAIQGAGGVFVQSVKGSVSNVVGLPLTTVVDLARSLGFDLVG